MFGPKTAKFGPKLAFSAKYWHFWPIWSHARTKNNVNRVPRWWSVMCRLIWCTIGRLVGGCGARAVSCHLFTSFNTIFQTFGRDRVANRAEKTCIRSCGQLSPQWSLLKTSRSQFQQTPLSHFASEQRLNFLRWWSEDFSNLFNIVPFNWQRKRPAAKYNQKDKSGALSQTY